MTFMSCNFVFVAKKVICLICVKWYLLNGGFWLMNGENNLCL